MTDEFPFKSFGMPFLLQLQVDVGFNQNLNSTAVPAPNLSPSDFPALSGKGDNSNLQKYGDDIEPSGNSYRCSDKENLLFFKSSPSILSGGAADFVSAVKKLAFQNSRSQNHEKTSSTGSGTGSGGSSHVLASSFNNVYGVKNRGMFPIVSNCSPS